VAAVTERCACGQVDFSGDGLGGVVLEVEIGFEVHSRFGCSDADEPLFAPGEEN